MINALISFLIQKGYIRDCPSYISRVCKGTTSINYIIKNGQQKYVYKVMYDEKRLQNILSNFKLVEKGSYAPKLLSDRIEFQGRGGVLMEYKSGKILKPNLLNDKICNDLVSVYNRFLKDINLGKTSPSILSEHDLIKLKKLSLERLSQKQHFWIRPFTNYFVHWLQAIPDTELVRDPQKMQVVHGDFKPRNVLLSKDNRITILDLEGLIFGYPSEDWARFIMRSIERIMDPWRIHQFRKKQINILEKKLAYSAKDWRMGYYNFLIQKLEKKSRVSLSLYQCLNLLVIIYYATKLMDLK